MGPMRCSEAPEPRAASVAPGERLRADRELLAIARASVEHGLSHGTALPVDPRAVAPALLEERPCFVTLRRDGLLRGCVGSLEARATLAAEAACNAFRAAFEDPRFDPLQPEELAHLEIHVSVLSPLEKLAVHSEAELLRALRPGVDGIVLSAGASVATLLPAVWAEIGESRAFVRALKRKAGLLDEVWSPSWRCQRFTAREVG